MRNFQIVLALFTFPLFADVISLRADNWCPYNCDPNSSSPGYMIEIAKTVFEKAGHSVDYQIMPWTRTLAEVRKGTINGAIGASMDGDKDLIYGEEVLGMGLYSFFANSKTTWTFTNVKSLEQITLGLIQDYEYTPIEMSNYILKRKNEKSKIEFSFGDEAVRSNIKKLSLDRIQATYEETNVFNYYVKEMKLKDSDFRVAGKFEGDGDRLSIGFSPANEKSKQYASILSNGIKELRQSGALAKILAKYNVKDWK